MELTSAFPIFEHYDTTELHRKTGYSEAYIVDVKNGRRTANPKFRKMCAAVLRRPEAELFSTQEAPQQEQGDE